LHIRLGWWVSAKVINETRAFIVGSLRFKRFSDIEITLVLKYRTNGIRNRSSAIQSKTINKNTRINVLCTLWKEKTREVLSTQSKEDQEFNKNQKTNRKMTCCDDLFWVKLWLKNCTSGDYESIGGCQRKCPLFQFWAISGMWHQHCLN
jgi:hypothetical protein